MKAPAFWYRPHSVLERLLSPLGHVYGWTVARRFKHARPYQADIPVICVGNLSVGGTGKTPVCLALGALLQAKGIPFFFLNHGYKARLKGVIADPWHMTPLETGDEALLLAEAAPTVVDNHRARGAQIAKRQGAKAVIMDDGFQDPGLIKTLSFVVIDGPLGFGNGSMIPAGPLREPVAKGLARADAVIIAGPDQTGAADTVKHFFPDMPILKGSFQPEPADLEALAGHRISAFAGIGQPEKFFRMLSEHGLNLGKQTAYPDHYFYTRFDIEQLISESAGMKLATTTKDFVKIPRDLRDRITVVRGHFVFDDSDAVNRLLTGIFTA